MKSKYKKLDYDEEDLESLSSGDLKKLGDYWLRQYLLRTVTNPQFCPIKKKLVDTYNMQVAHYIDRQCMALRYDLKNCHLISKFSNEYDAQVQVEGYKSLHHKEYEEFLIEEYGQEAFEDLKSRGKELKMFTKKDYINYINKYRNNE